MAEYHFVVKLPAARSGGTPDCNKWTFHHILPWKYFYCLSAVLGYYYAGALNSFVRGSPVYGTAEGIADLPDTAGAFGDIVTCNKSIVHSVGASIFSFVDMKRLIDGLARTKGGSATEKITGASSADRLRSALVECTSPVFGGFPGMDGKQRSDDPGSSMEKTRPFNGEVAWWNAVTAIGNALELASYWPRPKDRDGCKAIASSVYGDKVKFKLTNESLDLILGHLRTVVTPAYNSAVLGFDEKTWLVDIPRGRWGITVAENDYLYASVEVGAGTYKFMVSSVDAHAGKSAFIEMTRCPGVDNEKNILKPTASSAKVINGQ